MSIPVRPRRPATPSTPLATTASPVDGLKSDVVRAALAAALAGRPAELETWLCRYGSGAEQRPNLKLAAALGSEIGGAGAKGGSSVVMRLLARLAGNDAAPDTPEVFLPLAGAYGWAALAQRRGADGAAAWVALCQLAGDERAPVRMGTREALRALTARPGGASDLLGAALGWLDGEDRELRWGATGVVLELLADRTIVASLAAPGGGGAESLLDYASRVIADVVGAARSAERSDARRRVLLALPGACAAIAAQLQSGDRGPAWLEAECAAARQPDVRAALSSAILTLRKLETGPALVQRLRTTLEGSAKPPRDPTRRRPGHGRGKESRRMK